MTNSTPNITASLDRAIESATATCESLQTALSPATAVEGLVLLALLQRARELERDIQQFQEASQSDAEARPRA